MERSVPERTALYYPRIHFPNEAWLEATVLAFGKVHRIVPDDHPLDRDPPSLRGLSSRHLQRAGRDDADALIVDIDPSMQDIELAQGHLYRLLEQRPLDELQERFGRIAAWERSHEVGTYEIRWRRPTTTWPRAASSRSSRTRCC